jgi:hypothetical protein
MRRLIAAYHATGAKARIFVRLDDDDPQLGEYKKLLYPDTFVIAVAKERGFMPRALKECFKLFPAEDSYGILGDDVLPRTMHWDELLEGAVREGRIAWGKDGQNPSYRGTHPLMDGRIARAWDRLTIDGLVHLYNDTVWMHLARELDAGVYLDDVYMEHLHFSTGKARIDETYRRVDENGNPYQGLDAATFSRWVESGAARRDVEDIRRALGIGTSQSVAH